MPARPEHDYYARLGVRCGGSRKVEELFSAWLAVPPGAADGEVLTPSAELPGTVEPVRFRVEVFKGRA